MHREIYAFPAVQIIKTSEPGYFSHLRKAMVWIWRILQKNIANQILGIGSNGIVSWLKGSHGVKPMARLGIPTMVLVLPCALVLPIRTHLH